MARGYRDYRKASKVSEIPTANPSTIPPVATLPYGCRCGQRWGGLKTAHCETCHYTFTSVSSFDQHRRKGDCYHPHAVGLERKGRSYECWGLPGTRENYDEE